MFPTLAAFLLLAAPDPAPLRLPPLPARLGVDGDLAEWSGPPTLLLGPSGQVEGMRRPRAGAGLSARVWLAAGPEGLAIAADVRDERVGPPGSGRAAAGPLELWVGLPPPALPPVAFANQFGDQPTPAACEALGAGRKACLAWHEAQVRRRQVALARLFLRQFLLSASGVTEAFASAVPEVAALSPPCCAGARVAVKEAPGGWRVEALLPLGHLPATGRAGLSDLRVLVDVAGEGLVAFAPGAPGRALGKPESLLAARLVAPVPFRCDAPGLEARFAARKGEGPGPAWAVFPGKTVGEALVLENVRRGYQYAPGPPSPEVTRVPLAARPLVEAGGLRVVDAAIDGVVAAGQGTPLHGVVLLRGGAVVAVHPLWQARVAAAVRDGETARLLVVRKGTVSLHGSGSCGACALLEVVVLEAGPAGLRELLHESISEGVPFELGGRRLLATGLRATFDPGLGEVGVAGKAEPVGAGGREEEAPFAWRWRFSPATRRYEPIDAGARERDRARSR